MSPLHQTFVLECKCLSFQVEESFLTHSPKIKGSLQYMQYIQATKSATHLTQQHSFQQQSNILPLFHCCSNNNDNDAAFSKMKDTFFLTVQRSWRQHSS